MNHELRCHINEQLSHTDKAAIARSIFQTDDADEISNLLQQYCQEEFGQRITDCTLAYFSVGATFIVQLANAQAIVLKAYGNQQSLMHLTASFRVQQQLATVGFGCPQVLRLPRDMNGIVLTVQSAMDAGERVAPMAEFVRRSMAGKLAELMQTTTDWSGAGLSVWMDLDQPGLWHRSHNILFEFQPSSETAWIDEIASTAKAVLRSWDGKWTIGHSDWSLQNMSFHNGQLIGVFDWDSLRIGPEAGFLGGAARCFRHDWRYGTPEPAISIDEIQNFVQEYAVAGGRTLSSNDRQILNAAIIYTAAYGVRCAAIGQAASHYQAAQQQLLKFVEHFPYQ